MFPVGELPNDGENVPARKRKQASFPVPILPSDLKLILDSLHFAALIQSPNRLLEPLPYILWKNVLHGLAEKLFWWQKEKRRTARVV